MLVTGQETNGTMQSRLIDHSLNELLLALASYQTSKRALLYYPKVTSSNIYHCARDSVILPCRPVNSLGLVAIAKKLITEIRRDVTLQDQGRIPMTVPPWFNLQRAVSGYTPPAYVEVITEMLKA